MTRGRPKLYTEADAGFDVAAFRAWLESDRERPPTVDERGRRRFNRQFRGYQPSSVRGLVDTAMRLERWALTGERAPAAWPRNPQVHQTAGRLLAWAQVAEAGALDPEFLAALRAFVEGWRGPAERKQPERSIDEAQWSRFLDACAARPKPEALVLRLMSATGLRVGDVLRIGRAPVLAASTNTEGLIDLTVKGGKECVRSIAGAEAEWRQLAGLFRAARASNVAELVTPGRPEPVGGLAYMRVKNELQAVAKLTALTGRVHLHRLRRTVAIRALRETGDLDLVRQLLDQGSIHTTMKYVGEARIEDVAKLQRALAERKKK